MRVPTHRKEYNRTIEMRLFILYNLQLEIINFLYKNLRKADLLAAIWLTFTK